MSDIIVLDYNGEAVKPKTPYEAIIQGNRIGKQINKIHCAPAQMAMAANLYQNVVIVNSCSSKFQSYKDDMLMQKSYPMTFGGLPVEADLCVPDSEMRFLQDSEEIVRIKNLAVPKFS